MLRLQFQIAAATWPAVFRRATQRTVGEAFCGPPILMQYGLVDSLAAALHDTSRHTVTALWRRGGRCHCH